MLPAVQSDNSALPRIDPPRPSPERDRLLFAENVTNRDYAASALEQLRLDLTERKCLKALFCHFLWPDTQAKCSLEKQLEISDLIGPSGCCRSNVSPSINRLVQRGIVVRRRAGKSFAYSINWSAVFEFWTPTADSGRVQESRGQAWTRPDRDASRMDASTRLDLRSGRVHDDLDASMDKPVDSFTLHERAVNALEEIAIELRLIREAVTNGRPLTSDLNTSGRVQAMDASRCVPPLNSNSIESKDISLNSIQLKRTPADASKAGRVQKNPNLKDWPVPRRTLTIDDLRDDERLNANFEDAVTKVGWPADEGGRRDFFTLAEYALKLFTPKDQGQKAIGSFINGVRAGKHGHDRTLDERANQAASERLKRFHANRKAREHPQDSAQLEQYIETLNKAQVLSLLSAPEFSDYRHYVEKAISEKPGRIAMKALKQVLAGHDLATARVAVAAAVPS